MANALLAIGVVVAVAVFLFAMLVGFCVWMSAWLHGHTDEQWNNFK